MEQRPGTRLGAPLHRVGIRETWAQFRGSSAFQDLLAECGLRTAAWIGFPPTRDSDCAEEFALCAAAWSELPYYDDAPAWSALDQPSVPASTRRKEMT
jgi:hypothetical protein